MAAGRQQMKEHVLCRSIPPNSACKKKLFDDIWHDFDDCIEICTVRSSMKHYLCKPCFNITKFIGQCKLCEMMIIEIHSYNQIGHVIYTDGNFYCKTCLDIKFNEDARLERKRIVSIANERTKKKDLESVFQEQKPIDKDILFSARKGLLDAVHNYTIICFDNEMCDEKTSKMMKEIIDYATVVMKRKMEIVKDPRKKKLFLHFEDWLHFNSTKYICDIIDQIPEENIDKISENCFSTRCDPLLKDVMDEWRNDYCQ
jgi:hypothetical protein